MVNRAYNPNTQREFLSAYVRDISKFATFDKIYSGIKEILKISVSHLLHFDIKNAIKLRFKIEIIKWTPFINTLKPKVYISTSSVIGEEPPIVVYLNGLGVHTIIWEYGTNSYLFIRRNGIKCNFRNIIFCNILSNTLVVWNKHFRDFIMEHPQDETKVKILGPLMSADEDVMQISRRELAFRYKIPYNSYLKYISIFDSPPLSSKFRVMFPDSNTSQYNFAFINDMYRLVKELNNVVLVYKPKRSLTSGKFVYSESLKELFNNMMQDERAVFLDYNINPWVPIGIADICISLPFESPTIAGIHYQKPSLFYDPFNIALHHRYQEFPGLIFHNYDELKMNVCYWLYENNSRDISLAFSRIRDLQGMYPGENSSNKFRDYLGLLANSKEKPYV